MNPLTTLSFAASAWILILGVNNPWLSAFFLVAALLWRRVLVPTALLVLPMALSLALIHIPFGHAHLAAELALRCASLVAVALAAFSAFTVADLAKAMQATRAPANLSYILSSALRILPEGRATFEKVRYAQYLAYRRPVNPLLSTARALLPTITHLLDAGAQRAPDLEVLGVGLPGRRTVLRPVPDSAMHKALRIIVPAAAIAVVIALWM